MQQFGRQLVSTCLVKCQESLKKETDFKVGHSQIWKTVNEVKSSEM